MAVKKERVSQDDKNMALLAHILALFTGFLGPLIVYLVKSDSKFVRENARNALNFQISMLIYFIISFFLVFVIIGLVIIPVLVVFNLVVIILAAVKASEGVVYKYPLTINFLK